MALGHIGAFFAFTAFILLIFVCVSAPVWNDVYFLKVNLSNGVLVLGNWGACIKDAGSGNTCTSTRLGYDIQTLLDQLTNSTETFRDDIVHGLTYALILHPIAAGFAFLAFLLAVCSHLVTHILGSIVAFFATLITLVALGIDLGLFISSRDRINDQAAGSPASLGNAMWMVVGALAALFLASFTICCGGIRDRRNRRSSAGYNNGTNGTAYDGAAYDGTTEKRVPFWRRRRTAAVV